MNLTKRIEAFSELGNILRLIAEKRSEIGEHLPYPAAEDLWRLVNEAHFYNPWFTPTHVSFAFRAIGASLALREINAWLSLYPSELLEPPKKGKIGVVSAGNIPLAGFHDFICVLMSGYNYSGKLSSKDDKLPKTLADLLIQIEPGFSSRIIFEEERLSGFDAVIATGSNNSARYFDYYFGKYPHLIRKNRNSIAILDNKETKNDLDRLADDILLYFGLGCRNVSKLYVPRGYGFGSLFQALEKYASIACHHKHMNNYEYNRTIFLINQTPHLDNGFMLLREDKGLASPIGVLYFEFYDQLDELITQINGQADQLQCIVSNLHMPFPVIGFGQSQNPTLHDYADNIDTMEFLLSLNQANVVR